MYGAAAFLMYEAKNDYRIAGTKIVLKKGTTVTIPSHSIHNDPEYYPNPELFDPDRFNNDEKMKRDPMTSFPFGSGSQHW